ncbi:MAG: putative ester cyclase [Armatimonadetes bacterium CSP1-3]|nr:MAG: putative ester cyclase [Armatimonadetes bacterium CSP1-3]
MSDATGREQSDEAKALVERVYSAFNRREAEALESLLSSEFVDHTAGEGQQPGVEGIKRVWQQLWTIYPDIQVKLEDMFGEGDRVVSRVFFWSPSQDRPIGFAIEIFQVAGGRVIALWNVLKLGRT